MCVDAPSCRGDTRDPVLRLDLFFVDHDSAKFSGFFVPLQRVSGDGRDIHLSPKVPGEIAKVSSLFDDRAGTVVTDSRRSGKKFQLRRSKRLPLGFVPPVWLGDRLICASVAGNGGHDLEVVCFDRLFHHLDGFEVSKHISGSPLLAPRWNRVRRRRLTRQSRCCHCFQSS